MKALEWITKEAKKIRKEYPKRFATWREYVAQASSIYASKHKGKSPVEKKKIGAIKIVEKGESKNAKPKAVYEYSRSKKGTFKGLKKIGATKSLSKHTDTKSHNINIKMGNYITPGPAGAVKSGKGALNRLKIAAEKYIKYRKKYFDAVAITNNNGYVVLTLAKNVKAVYTLSFVSIIHKGKESFSKPQFILYLSSGTVLRDDEDKNPTYKLISKFNK